MNLSKIAVNRPTTVLIIFIIIIALGIYASLDLPLDLFPEINPPVLFIFTDYSSAGPEEIEKLITRPLESALGNVENIEKITSASSEGNSQITVEFTYGTNMAEAANDVRDKLEFIKQYLPDDADPPMIFKFDPSMIPIMYLAVTGNRSPEELRKIGVDIIQPRLEQVEGIAMASVIGGRERIIRVEIPQNRLQAYNITLTQIANMLSTQNWQISAGSITEGNKNYLIRTSGEFKDIEEIKNTVIAYKGGYQPQSSADIDSSKVILLRDVANVYDGLKKEEEAAYINGQPAVQIIIQKQSGTNSVKAADNVYYKIYKEKNLKKINKLKNNKNYKSGSLINELPKGVNIEVVYDNTKMIRNSLSQVSSTAITGAILAILILFIFLRSFKSIIIIGVSIPISVILTLLLMYFFGFTLNIMTLAGLALGIGMLVDNSIVILENIYRYREKGAKLHSAAIIGSQEMINAIVASTLTTICVFAPVVMFKSQLEMWGELFIGLAFTVVFSLSTSLLVAIFLVPVLSSRYLQLESQMERNLTGIYKLFDDKMDKFLKWLDNKYTNGLKFVLSHRKMTIITVLIIFILSLLLIIPTGFQLMPPSDEDYVNLKLELPIGTKLDITRDYTKRFEEIIKKEVKGYKSILSRVGEKGFHGYLGAPQSHKSGILITLDDNPKNRPQTSSEIQKILRKHFNDFPSVIFEFDKGRHMGGSASPIDILVKSDDLKRAKTTADKILQILKENVPEVTEPIIDMKEGLPQIEIVIDREKAYSLGLNIYNIGEEIKASIDGTVKSQFREGGDEYDILVILDPKDKDEIPDLEQIFVINNNGYKIPLSSIAYIPEESSGPVNIKREDQKRTIHISGGIAKKIKVDNPKFFWMKEKRVKLNEVELKIRKLIREKIPQDEDLIIEFSGDFADLIKYFFKLMLIFLIAGMLVFGIMASQFESFLDPFIIMFTVLLSFIGVSLIYFITNEQLNILAIVGLIVLVGIVVNNGIVLVDYTNLLVKRGYGIIEACIEAGRNRLRPILMTTLTTILGLIPMALVKVEGAEMSRPIAKTVVGGLTVCTIFTLFLVPVIYSIFNQFSEKRKIKSNLKRQQQLEIRREKLQAIKK